MDIETQSNKSSTHTLHNALPYDILKRQRDKLLEAEEVRENRIKQLERNSEKVLKVYEETRDTNETLRSLLTHGPSVTKVKKLRQENNQKSGEIEKIQEENHALTERLKNIERRYHIAKADAKKAEWKAILTKSKKRREIEEAIPTEGPFDVNSHPKKISIEEPVSENDYDAYDVQLHNIKKESDTLASKINQLNREKEQIDLTRSLGRGNIIRNAHVVSVISEKLNRDLNKLTQRLEKLKLKHDAVKSKTSQEIEVKDRFLTDLNEIRSVRSYKRHRNLNQLESAYFSPRQQRMYTTDLTKSMLDMRSGELVESMEFGKRLLSLKALRNQKLTSGYKDENGLRQLSQDRNTLVHTDANYTPPSKVAAAYEMDKSQDMTYTCTCMGPIPVRFRVDGKTITRRNSKEWK